MIKFVKAFGPIVACWLLVGACVSLWFNDSISIWSVVVVPILVALVPCVPFTIVWWVSEVYDEC